MEELDAFQLASDLKCGIYALVAATPAAKADWRFRDQLFDAAASVSSCMAEGFERRSPAEFSRFLGYSRSSLAEARLWLQDGVDRTYFAKASIEPLLRLAFRCRLAIEALQRTQERFKRSRSALPSSSRASSARQAREKGKNDMR